MNNKENNVSCSNCPDSILDQIAAKLAILNYTAEEIGALLAQIPAMVSRKELNQIMKANKEEMDVLIGDLTNKIISTDQMAKDAKHIAIIAKNAVATLEGFANADEAAKTLAQQVVQIETNKQDIARNKQITDEQIAELEKKVGQSLGGTVITIGDNGNWFLDGVDSGVRAKGEDGENGVSLGEITLANELSSEPGSEKKAITQYAVTMAIGAGISDRPSTESSMGYKVLKKDLAFAEQVTEPNTIYEIRDTFDLAKAGESKENPAVAIPENCILKFNGGQLKNGTLKGNNTSIDAAAINIFNQDVNFDGVWSIPLVYVEWFGATSMYIQQDKVVLGVNVTNLPDSSDAINTALRLTTRCGGKAVCTGVVYRTDKTIYIHQHETLYVSPQSCIVPVMHGNGYLPDLDLNKVTVANDKEATIDYSIRADVENISLLEFVYSGNNRTQTISLSPIETSKVINNLEVGIGSDGSPVYYTYSGYIRITFKDGTKYIGNHCSWKQQTGSPGYTFNKPLSDYVTNNKGQVLALNSNLYIPNDSMAKAIVMQGYSSRIEGHGRILLFNSTYTIGIFMVANFYTFDDMIFSNYIDIRTQGGYAKVTAPDIEDTFGEGKPTQETLGIYYFDTKGKVEYYKNTDGVWMDLSNANALYNTSLRISLVQTDSDYRIINPRINIWDIFGFRGVECIQKGRCWFNQSTWDGAVSNKCSNYVSFFGTNMAAHYMQKMCYQSGVEQNRHSPIAYCEAHDCHYGNVWDPTPKGFKGNKVIVYFTKASYGNSIEWITSPIYVSDLGENNRTVPADIGFNKNAINNISSYTFKNVLSMVRPLTMWHDTYWCKSKKFYEDIKQFMTASNNEAASPLDNEDKTISLLPGTLFDETYNTNEIVIDTSNNIYATTWYLCWQGNMSWAVAQHFYLYIEYSIESDDDDYYVAFGHNMQLYNDVKLQKPYSNNSRFYEVIPIGGSIGTSYLCFYTKKNGAGKKLRVYNVKLYVDTFNKQFSPTTYNYDRNFGKTENRPNASYPGHLYFDIDNKVLLENRGNSNNVRYADVKTFKEVIHDTYAPISDLIPNVYHKYGIIDSLKISSFKKVSADSVDMYVVEFTTPSDISTFKVEISGVKWINGNKLGTEQAPILPETTYQINVTNNLVSWGGFK